MMGKNTPQMLLSQFCSKYFPSHHTQFERIGFYELKEVDVSSRYGLFGFLFAIYFSRDGSKKRILSRGDAQVFNDPDSVSFFHQFVFPLHFPPMLKLQIEFFTSDFPSFFFLPYFFWLEKLPLVDSLSPFLVCFAKILENSKKSSTLEAWLKSAGCDKSFLTVKNTDI